MRRDSKFKLLNALLAAGNPFAKDIYAAAATGMDAAFKVEKIDVSISDFAKKALRLYDKSAEVEVIDFEGQYFDPLFAISRISTAIKKLSGYNRAILVISGLERAGIPEGGRMSAKRRDSYSQNVEFVENYVLRYETIFPNLEIVFI